MSSRSPLRSVSSSLVRSLPSINMHLFLTQPIMPPKIYQLKMSWVSKSALTFLITIKVGKSPLKNFQLLSLPLDFKNRLVKFFRSFILNPHRLRWISRLSWKYLVLAEIIKVNLIFSNFLRSLIRRVSVLSDLMSLRRSVKV